MLQNAMMVIIHHYGHLKSVYITHFLSVGLIHEAQKYKSAVGNDREYGDPWGYRWE